MVTQPYQERLKRCSQFMKEFTIDILLLTKPANMFYLTGDGRLCSYAMITQEGKVALGVPQTDVEDVRKLAHFDHIVGFDDEVGMIHSIAHNFEHFGIQQGSDLTEALRTAPHDEGKILGMPLIGELVTSEAEIQKPVHEKVFYFMAYTNLVFVFLITFVIALWKWG